MVKRLKVKKRKEILSELTQEIPANGIITVGNDSSATIELKDEKIAPEQFVIVCEEGAMTLLCRVDGTAVNGEILPQGALHDLQYGDEITIDGYTLTAESETNGEKSTAETRAETTGGSAGRNSSRKRTGKAGTKPQRRARKSPFRRKILLFNQGSERRQPARLCRNGRHVARLDERGRMPDFDGRGRNRNAARKHP